VTDFINKIDLNTEKTVGEKRVKTFCERGRNILSLDLGVGIGTDLFLQKTLRRGSNDIQKMVPLISKLLSRSICEILLRLLEGTVS